MSNQLEVFKPLIPNEVSMYVCGPTVYNYVHIGNMRPVVTFDVLKRLFTYIGYKVTHISNITDVDDKIINESISEGVSEEEIAQKYADSFFKCCDEFNAILPTYTPRVTQTIPQIIAFIKNLVDIGYAYVVDGDVFFRVSKVAEYGKLGNFHLEDLKTGARIEENNKKEHPADFALWKKTDVGIKWPSPWGEGRPGWHTECVVMIGSHYPQSRIDIHGGGFDLKFPHHENEIAQARACYGNEIASYWLHNGFVNIGDVKMSKSIGNVRLAKDLLAHYDGAVLRLIMLSSHYRAPINFSDETLDSAIIEYNKIVSTIRQAEIKMQTEGIRSTESIDDVKMNLFLDALCNDMNTSNGLTILYDLLKELNQTIRQNKAERLAIIYQTVKHILDILGLKYRETKLTESDIELFKNWNAAKKAADYEEADALRKVLMEKGLL